MPPETPSIVASALLQRHSQVRCATMSTPRRRLDIVKTGQMQMTVESGRDLILRTMIHRARRSAVLYRVRRKLMVGYNARAIEPSRARPRMDAQNLRLRSWSLEKMKKRDSGRD